jgi:hypothetical protein
MPKFRASYAAEKLIDSFNFTTLLDVGCGDGIHSDYFKKQNKIVTSTDYQSNYPGCVIGDYNLLNFKKHDCVWASHILEHQLNVNHFLKKLRNDTIEGGIVCVSVPPLKHNIVGGHVSLWNAGVLLYNLVLAGFDCKDCSIKKYKYNISIIAKAKIFEIPKLNYDNGDISLLKPWLPNFCDEGFDGDIEEWNW